MNKLYVYLLVVFAFISNCAVANEISVDKRKLILQFMEMRGYSVEVMGQRLVHLKIMRIQNYMQSAKLNVPQETIQTLKEDVSKVVEEGFVKPNKYTDLAVNIYDSYLTTEELKDIIEFANTPSGKKFMQYTAVIDGDVDHAANGLLSDVNKQIEIKVNDTLSPYRK